MARVQLGETVVGLRGKIGGLVFSANGSVAYCKPWVYPTYKRTVLQNEKRDWLTTIRHDWETLDSGQIALWDALAAAPPEVDYDVFGNVIYLSGSAWHTRVNMRRLQAGQVIESDCPVNASVDPPVTFGLELYDYNASVGVDKFTYTDGDFTGYYAVLHLSVAYGVVRNVQTTGYLSIWCGEVDAATETEIHDEIVAAFGLLQTGQKVFGRLWKQSTTGIRSVVKETTTIVLADE